MPRETLDPERADRFVGPATVTKAPAAVADYMAQMAAQRAALTASGSTLAERQLAKHAAALNLSQVELAAVDAESGFTPWSGVLAPEGIETSDLRLIEPGALSWRELPLTLMAQFSTPEMGGHAGSVVAGRIDSIVRDGAMLRGAGVFANTPDGQKAVELIKDGFLNGVSIDLAVSEAEMRGPGGNVLDEDSSMEDWMTAVFVVIEGEILGATVCPFPAFAEGRIEIDDPIDPVAAEAIAAAGYPRIGRQLRVLGDACWTIGRQRESANSALVAGLAPARPPRDWFDDPKLEEATPLTVTDEGRIYGHVAAWGTCHIGFPGKCIDPPTEADPSYPLFQDCGGEIVLEDGSRIGVGKLTMGTGHADLRLSALAAASHYDDTGTTAGYVRCGNDEHGIWIAGAVSPSLDADRARELMASKVSGDWRPMNGAREMVAVLAVNVPGFPIVRPATALSASGLGDELVPGALVAAGLVCGCDPAAVAHRAALFAVARKGRAGAVSELVERARG